MYKYLLISLILFGCGCFVTYAQWADPTVPPPSGSPYRPLHVGGASQTKAGSLYIMGKVGIGTETPNGASLLHLKTATGTNAEIDIQSGSKGHWGIYQDETTEQLRLWNVGNHLVVTKDGNVGIGTTGPYNKLNVNGILEVGTGTRGVQLSSTAADNFSLMTQTNIPNTNWNIGTGNGSGSLDATKPYITSNVSFISLMSGNVGIGTVAPGSPLTVYGAASPSAVFTVGAGSGGDTDKIFRVLRDTSPVVEAISVFRNGNLRVVGSITNEQGKPAFLVNINADDCGWGHPYLGCPSGYAAMGSWHVSGPDGCDSHPRGYGYENGSISSGWVVLCVTN